MPSIPKPGPLKRQKARKARENAKRAKAFRDAVWKAHGPFCRSCGAYVIPPQYCVAAHRAGYVHHLTKPRSLREKYDSSNGALVCQSCHAKVHAGTVKLL